LFGNWASSSRENRQADWRVAVIVEKGALNLACSEN